MIIAIDGPAGTGKGTISKLIADRLGFGNIDTGAMYRAVTLKILREEIPLDDLESIQQLLENTRLSFNEDEEILLDGENVSHLIRTQEINRVVSQVSAIRFIREKLVIEHRNFAKGRDIVMEGRDITTVVFPDADLKIYLTADVEERAQRRYKEMLDKGVSTTYQEVLEGIKERDYQDMHKEYGALMIAPDAIVVDTTGKSIEEVYNEVTNYIKREEN